MVWEQRCRGVVMLNRVIEKGSVREMHTIPVSLYHTCHIDINTLALPETLLMCIWNVWMCCVCVRLVLYGYNEEVCVRAGKVCSVLASARGEGGCFWGHKLQTYSDLRGCEIVLHSTTVGAGKSVGEALDLPHLIQSCFCSPVTLWLIIQLFLTLEGFIQYFFSLFSSV